MCKLQITRLLVGLFLALSFGTQGFAQSQRSQPSDNFSGITLKANGLIDHEILARAEGRAESLRAKLFDLQMQEIELQAYIEYLDFRMTPECIQRSLALVGTVRPMDELREALRKGFENEKSRTNKVLELLAVSRERLEAAITEAEAEVERLRQRLNPQ